MKYVDVAIVGAGIMGLAHAVHAVRSGLTVAVFERHPEARGASTRNFGMLAVVAQAPGKQLESARRALACWQEVALQAGIAIRRAGCLFLARAPEEMMVLEESAALNEDDAHSLELLSQKALSKYAPNLQSGLLLGGLWSPDAWKVDQRRALAKITNWLRREHEVSFHFATNVHAVTSGVLETSAGRFNSRQIIICGGDEFEALCPDIFRASGVKRCRLQMLRTAPQPVDWQLKPFILGGLSLPRYSLFETCPSLSALNDYQKRHYGSHLAHGVHIVACQEPDGSITIGDSHAYGDVLYNERSHEIDQLILNDLSGMISLPIPDVSERWMGRYAYLTHKDTLIVKPTNGVTAVTVTNGQGMTHSFSVAEDVIKDLIG